MKRLILLLVLSANLALAEPWPAKYTSANGTPCCQTEGSPVWDCAPVSEDEAAQALMGGVLTIQLANGPHRIVVNAIYESENAKSWACKPGCLFRHTGV